MTENERRHFDKLYARMIEFNNNKKIKNKAVLRLLDVISYLFNTTTYEIFNSDEVYKARFDISIGDKYEAFIITHIVGYGSTNNTVVSVEFSEDKDNAFDKYARRIKIFVGNRTRRNLILNVQRMFDMLPDQVKCELYLNGAKIKYDPND